MKADENTEARRLGNTACARVHECPPTRKVLKKAIDAVDDTGC
jgi:hypothetical protein